MNILQMPKYTIVMPIKKNTTGTGYEFFIRVGLKSYLQFLEIKDVDKFIVICPRNEVDHFYELFIDIKLPLHVIPEEQIIGKDLNGISGWFRQQLIKLAVSIYVNTEHYLVVDSDMYLNQMLCYEDLYYKGRIKYSSEPWQTENNNQYSTNSRWWIASCDLLNVHLSVVERHKNLMGVTPQVMVTKYVDELLYYVKDIYGSNWQRILCSKQFTEYTLYWTYLLIKGYTSVYTYEGYPLWKHDHETNVLDYVPEYKALDSIRVSFTNPVSHFSVVQSYLNIKPLDNVVNDIESCLDWSKNRSIKYEAIFLISSMLRPNRYQSFTVEERFEQTCDTVRSVREKVPNSYCILIEGSILSEEHQEAFGKVFDMILLLGHDDDIQKYVNDSRNIGHGELKLLSKGLEYVKTTRIHSKYLFKFGARYRLNDDFVLRNYSPTMYTFRQHFDASIGCEVYTTGLYTIPVDRMDEFGDFLDKSQEILSNEEPMIERVYKKLIPAESTLLIDTLGLEGELSYNKVCFKV